MSETYPMGSRVTFADGGTVVFGKDSVATGVVNGEPMTEGETTFVPVFAKRDRGREPTTIFVAESNVLKIEVPS